MPSNFGTTPTSTTTLQTNQFPISAGFVPGTASGNLTSVQLGPSSTDGNGYTSAPVATYTPDGNDLTIGITTDSAVTGDTSGTISAKLRGINKILAKLTFDGSSFLEVNVAAGSITANIGTTNGLALDTSVNGLLLSQGSTTSGQKGSLAQGAVTSSAPSYTTAQTSPLSLTLAGALRVDASATTQPVSGTFWQTTQPISAASGAFVDGSIATIGTKADAAQIDPTQSATIVAILKGMQTELVDIEAQTTTTPVVSGTVTTNQGGAPWQENITQFGSTNISTGTGASGAGIPRVTVSNDSNVLATQSGIWTVQPGNTQNTTAWLTQDAADGPVSAGTAAAKSILAGLVFNSAAPAPTNGQQIAAQADQAGNLRIFPGIALTTLSAWNSSTGSNATQTIFSNSGAPAVLLQLDQTTTLTGGAVTIEANYDGTNWISPPANTILDPTSTAYAQIANPYTFQASTNKPLLIMSNGWQALRIRLSTVISGTGAVTPYYALLAFNPVTQAVVYSPTAANFQVTVGAALPAGANTIGNVGLVAGSAVVGSVTIQATSGTALTADQSNSILKTSLYVKKSAAADTVLTFGSATSANSLPVVIASDQGAFPVSQSGSWTVTANAGTNLNTSALALDTSINGILLSQGSTTSGQKGALVQGAVTTSAPSYTTAQTSPLSLDSSGLLRVSLKDTPANTNNLNVNLAASAATVTVTAANLQTNLNQIGGNAVVTGGANGLLAVGGPVASGASNADNPIKVGGVFNTTQPTVTNGQIVDLQATARGGLIVATGTDTFNVTVNAALPAGANTIGAVTQASGPWTSNITQFGGVNVSTGTGASGNGIPRVTVSNDSEIQIWDGTNGPVAAKAARTSPTLADISHVHSISPNNTGLPVNLQAIVQKTNNKSSGSVASLALAFGSNNIQGNSIIVVCAVGNGTAPTISDTLSNTYTQAVQIANGSALNVAVFYAVNVASGANTVTVNNGGTTASIAMEIYEVSGLITQVQAQPSQTASNTGSSGTASTSNVGAASPNEYAFAGVGVGTAAQTITAGSGWTNDSGQQNPTTPAGLFSFVSMSQFLGSLKAVTPQATFASEPWAMAVATFRPVVLGIEGTINQGQSATSTITSVAGAASDTSLLASNTNRKAAYFYNDSTAILYLEFGSAAASTSNYTVQIPAQGFYEMPVYPVYTGAIRGIWSAANGNCRITELS